MDYRITKKETFLVKINAQMTIDKGLKNEMCNFSSSHPSSLVTNTRA